MYKILKTFISMLSILLLPLLAISADLSLLNSNDANVKHSQLAKTTQYQQMALGPYNNAVIIDDLWGQDHLLTWGNNVSGQIGNNNNSPIDAPFEIIFDEAEIKKVAISSNRLFGVQTHMGAITIDEQNNEHLYLWGKNDAGQLGLGHKNDTYIPTEITLAESKIKDIALSIGNTGVVTTDNDGNDHLYMWGKNNNGQLGTGDTQEATTPVAITLPETSIKNIAVGNEYAGAITVDNDGNDHLYMWGNNNNGQLGLDYSSVTKETSPVEISFPASKIEKLILSYDFSGALAINSSNEENLYMWGKNQNKQLGLGSSVTDAKVWQPTAVTLAESDIKTFALGSESASAVTIDTSGKDHLYTWGTGILGNNQSSSTVSEPTKITLPDLKIDQLMMGAEHGGIILEDEENEQHLYMWGDNAQKQIDFSNNANYLIPTQISTDSSAIIENVTIAEDQVVVEPSAAEFRVILGFQEINWIFEKIKLSDIIFSIPELPSDAKAKVFWNGLNQDNELLGTIRISNLDVETLYKNWVLNTSSLEHSQINIPIPIPSFTTKSSPIWSWIVLFVLAEVGVAILIGTVVVLIKVRQKGN